MKKFILISLLFVTSWSLQAQEPVGEWHGKAEIGGYTLRMNFDLKQTDGVWSGAMQSPDQSPQWIPFSSIEVDGETVHASIQAIAFSYTGKITGNKLEGAFTQMGTTYPLNLTLQAAPLLQAEETKPDRPVTDEEKSALGKWYGKAEVGGMSMRMNFDIELTDGSWSGAMQSVDQSGLWIPFSSIEIDGNTVRIAIESLFLSFTGKVNGDTLEGQYNQMGNTFPARFTREEIVRRRPQEPKPDGSYTSTDVTFRNEEAGINLAGTLTIPSTANAPYPAVILVTGSGPQDRDETILGHKPFWVIADHLTRNGIAVLRFDDRGVAQSEGDYAAASIPDFATDALAGIRYLRNRPDIDSQKVGLVGHSEGGMIGLLLAAEKNIDFMVSLAGPGISGRALMEYQWDALLSTGGAPEDFIRAYKELMNKSIDIALETDNPVEMRERFEKIYAGTLFETELDLAIAQLSSPEMRSFFAFDPAGLYPGIQCPLLALNGEKDVQVVAVPNLEGIRKGLAHNPQVTIKSYPDLNHLFQTAGTGHTSEYGEIEETFHPQVLKDMTEWILSITR